MVSGAETNANIDSRPRTYKDISLPESMRTTLDKHAVGARMAGNMIYQIEIARGFFTRSDGEGIESQRETADNLGSSLKHCDFRYFYADPWNRSSDTAAFFNMIALAVCEAMSFSEKEASEIVASLKAQASEKNRDFRWWSNYTI